MQDTLTQFVTKLQSQRCYVFTREAAQSALGSSDAALSLALNRLKKKGRIVSPRRGFYVIVPLEYSREGCPPPGWFVAPLLRYLGQYYYLGLHSAAAHYLGGPPPAEVQIITDRACRSSACGPYTLRFVQKAALAETPAREYPAGSGTGGFLVSTPEATLLDLVQYYDLCGGLSSVIEFLPALADQLDLQQLKATTGLAWRTPVLQRAGYLSELAGCEELAKVLESSINSPRRSLLDPGSLQRSGRLAKRWQLVLNTAL